MYLDDRPSKIKLFRILRAIKLENRKVEYYLKFEFENLFNLKHNYQKNPKIMFKNESLFVILID
jgi:hypothetical protein